MTMNPMLPAHVQPALPAHLPPRIMSIKFHCDAIMVVFVLAMYQMMHWPMIANENPWAALDNLQPAMIQMIKIRIALYHDLEKAQGEDVIIGVAYAIMQQHL